MIFNIFYTKKIHEQNFIQNYVPNSKQLMQMNYIESYLIKVISCGYLYKT